MLTGRTIANSVRRPDRISRWSQTKAHTRNRAQGWAGYRPIVDHRSREPNVIDLPTRENQNAAWLKALASPNIDYISANFLYDSVVERLDKFGFIWCTGVLYHNPEQLRMIRKLYDLLEPAGVLVIETATTRRRELQDQTCVEIIYPPSEEYKRRYHVSMNITHLPSARAVEAWLTMVGFEDVRRSDCHRQQSSSLAKNRVAFLCRKPLEEVEAKYLDRDGGYIIGKAL